MKRPSREPVPSGALQVGGGSGGAHSVDGAAHAQKVSIRGDGCNRTHHQNRRSLGAHRPLLAAHVILTRPMKGCSNLKKLGNEACQASRHEESEGCACTQACRDLAPDVDRRNRLHGQKARARWLLRSLPNRRNQKHSGGVITPATPKAKSHLWDDGSSQTAHNVVAFLRPRASRLVGPLPSGGDPEGSTNPDPLQKTLCPWSTEAGRRAPTCPKEQEGCSGWPSRASRRRLARRLLHSEA
jgi:hypothetical protein